MKKIICVILAIMLLCGCTSTTAEDGEAASIRYDWVADHSPIPDRITGIDLQGEDNVQNSFECSNSGFYAMCNGWMLYCDHGSDEIIKLCGRPDCTHTDENCNAYFEKGVNVCLEDGKLYVTINYTDLVQVDLDGTNRVTVLKAADFSETGSNTIESPHIWSGIYNVGMGRLNEDGEYILDVYYAPLDTDGKSMMRTSRFIPVQNDGDAYIVSTTEGMETLFWSWDPETNEKVYLTQVYVWDRPGYYGEEDAWFIENGVVYHLNYADGSSKTVLDTGLDGYHYLHCFPELFVISNAMDFWDEEPPSDEQNLYFYNWDFELIGQVTLPWLGNRPICGDTSDRIILSSHEYEFIPKYYINKSELGTENVQLHEFAWPEDFEDIYDKSKIDVFNPGDAEIAIDYGTWTEEDG